MLYAKKTLELKQCTSNPHWNNLLHHTCQDKYELDIGIEVMEMKYEILMTVIYWHTSLIFFKAYSHTDERLDQSVSDLIDIVDMSKIIFQSII